MSQFSTASVFGIAFGIATMATTFSQCGEANGNQPAAPQQGQYQPDQYQPDQYPQDPAPPPDTLHLLISGAMHGRLEPCGCASGQLGGLARRAQHIGERRNYDLLIEGGDLVGGNSELDTLKLWTTSTVLFEMQKYDALGVGPRDLLMPRDEWASFLAEAPVIATNLTCDDAAWPAKPYRDKTVRDFRVRMASLLLPELPAELRERDEKLQRTDPATAWRQAFADADDALLRIVLLHGDDARIREIVPQLDPRPDLAIGVDPAYIEPNAAPSMLGDVPLVFAGIRGRVLLDARLWRENGKPRIACELVPLAGSKTVPGGGGDPQVNDVILQHRLTVKDMDVLRTLAEQEPTPNGDSYVGSSTCLGCHPTAYQAWQKSKHAHAWQTLVDAERDPKRYGWPVTAYPDCVSCHVVGYGQKGGFVTFEDTPQHANVGCERCHGPASGHVASAGKKKLGIIGGELASVMCTQCHDFEQSPTFVYSERWAVIEHGKER